MSFKIIVRLTRRLLHWTSYSIIIHNSITNDLWCLAILKTAWYQPYFLQQWSPHIYDWQIECRNAKKNVCFWFVFVCLTRYLDTPFSTLHSYYWIMLIFVYFANSGISTFIFICLLLYNQSSKCNQFFI